VTPDDPPVVLIEVSLGELLDRISILEIKAGRLRDSAKLGNVLRELGSLRQARAVSVPPHDGDAAVRLGVLVDELWEVNNLIWEAEDVVRLYEAGGDFGPDFVGAARSIYRLNDRRAAAKRAVNLLFGSRIMEEKYYQMSGFSPRMPQ
jgi:hypothetical protein